MAFYFLSNFKDIWFTYCLENIYFQTVQFINKTYVIDLNYTFDILKYKYNIHINLIYLLQLVKIYIKFSHFTIQYMFK